LFWDFIGIIQKGSHYNILISRIKKHLSNLRNTLNNKIPDHPIEKFRVKKMLQAIILYNFELELSETGNITPRFVEVAQELSENLREAKFDSSIIQTPQPNANAPPGLITIDDLYGIFFNLTTGNKKGHVVCDTEVVEQTLQDTHYKVLAHFFQQENDLKYLFLAFFDVPDVVSEFYSLFTQTTCRIELATRTSYKEGKIDPYDARILSDRIQNELKNFMQQVERFYNLTKLQKIALIYSSPERLLALEYLRKGPMSREQLQEGFLRFKKTPNVDGIMRPFLELNIVRRDWVKPYIDRKTKQKFDEGEYFFLIRDIALIRRHPAELFEKIKKDSNLAKAYENRLVDFFHRYNPFNDILKESRKLAKYVLDSDVFDLLALLKTQYYPIEKFPKMLGTITELEELITRLREDELVYVIQDEDKRHWVCLLSEIVPLITFPEFLVEAITEKVSIKKEESDDKKNPQYHRDMSPEVAKLALKLLQSSYYEQIEVT
jgi:hypothetical protein